MIRLAAQCGQLDDVDGFVERMSADQLNELQAFSEIEPLGDDKVCTVIAMGFASLITLVSSIASDGRDSDYHFDPNLLMPWREVESRPSSDRDRLLTPNEMAAQFKLRVANGFTR